MNVGFIGVGFMGKHMVKHIVNGGHIIAEGDANTILSNEQVRNVYLGQNFRM